MINHRRAFPFDVFVSYSSQDLTDVENVITLLEQVGIKPWIDREKIRYGELTPAIKKGIEESRFFAFFQSGNTKNSQWLELEGKHFLETRGKRTPLPLILIKLSEGEPPLSLASLCTRTTHHIDLQKSFIDGVVRLMDIFLSNDVHRSMGLLRYFPSRGEVPPPVWDLLNARAGREINYIGHSMTPAFSDGRDVNLLLPALKRGVRMKVVLLTPNAPKLQQMREVQAGVEYGIDIQKKIEETIDHIRDLKHRSHEVGNDSKLQVRVTDKIMYSSVSIFDSLALVTNYSSRDEIGNNSPTFLVQQIEHGKGNLFDFYSEELARYWKWGIHPEEELHRDELDDSNRILPHEEQISRIRSWISGPEERLPPPLMLIIYPTYECWLPDKNGNKKLLCENCMYREKRISSESEQEQLDFDHLTSILNQSIQFGVRNFEFSGGGEPLQYKDIKQLLGFLPKIKTPNNSENGKKDKPIRFGLLTNGLHLSTNLVEPVASAFSYVRFNYAEGIEGNDEIEKIFVTNLKAFLMHVENRWSEPRVGLKLLLSKNNSETLVRNLLNLKKNLGPLFNRINHIRIRAMRSQTADVQPSDADSLGFKNEFFDHVFTNRDDWPEDIKVDLALQYVGPDFKCWINPLIALVAPDGSLLPCWNYLRDQQRLTIGNLKSDQLETIWGSSVHRKIVKSLNAQQVCNARNGCPCRFVRYQQRVSGSDRAWRNNLPSAINGFI